jgi:hypothetical protein
MNPTETARAFATYSLVPYLGILFSPGALVIGSVAVIRSHRTPDADGRAGAYLTIVAALIIFATQLLLWWIMYKLPEWAKAL